MGMLPMITYTINEASLRGFRGVPTPLAGGELPKKILCQPVSAEPSNHWLMKKQGSSLAYHATVGVKKES